MCVGVKIFTRRRRGGYFLAEATNDHCILGNAKLLENVAELARNECQGVPGPPAGVLVHLLPYLSLSETKFSKALRGLTFAND